MADDYGSSVGAGNLGAVTIGGSATGSLEVGGDHDWFRITLVAGQSYIFNLDRNSLSDPFLVLRDQNGVDIVGNDDIVTNVNFNSQIRFTATVSGTYFLDAFSSDGTATGTYTVRAAIDPSPPASNDDYGAQAGSPDVGSIAVGGSVTGNLETINDRDWFAITLVAGTSYTFRQESISLADPLLRLRDGNGVLITSNDDGGGGLNSQITYTAATTGVYYLEANTADAGQPAGTGTYRITAAVNGSPPPAPVDDYGSQAGAGNLGTVAVGSSSTGLINYGGDHDWFAVTLSAGSIYRIRQEAGTLADPRFSLRNAIGVVLTGDDDSGGGQNAQVDFTATSSGTYYIDANSADGNGTGTYTVRLTLLYGAPVIASNAGSTALEGGTDIVTSAELSTTDPDSSASAIVYTLTSLATNGTLTRNGTAIALNGTFTQADINANLIAFTHNGSETTSGSFGFSVTDGTTSFTGRTFNFAVTPVNDAPTATGLQGDSVTTTEPAGGGSTLPAVRIDAGGNATLADVDNLNFNGGSIRFAITAGGAAAQDQLSFDTAAVTIAGGSISVGGTAVGTVSGGGAGAGDLVVALNANATPARVQALIRAVQFTNTGGDNPTAGVRTITTTLNDGGGTANGGTSTLVVTSTVTVVAVDDAPTAVADSGTTTEAATTVISPLANDTDPDGGTIGYALINGVAVAVGASTMLASGATVTRNADNTLTYNPNNAFNYLVSAATAAATGASNGSAIDSFSYQLAPGTSSTTVSVTVNGIDGAGSELRGDAGNNTLTGTAASDYFNLSQGGNDSVGGGNGNDAFFFGAAFTAADSVDGGAGANDQIGLQGDYTGANALTLGASTISNVEVIAALPGFSYSITTVDANIPAGQNLIFYGTNLAAGNNFTVNVSAETNGTVTIYGGLGTDTFTGGAGNDGFYFGPGRFGAGDFVNGGAGTNDQLALDGNYTITVSAAQLQNVEVLALLRGVTGDLANYNITLADDLVGAGQTFTVFGLPVETGFTLNATAETNGNITVFGGSGADTISTGAGNDRIFGGGGADVLNGGAGADTFVYDAVSQSTGAGYDRVTGFVSGTDRFDFDVAVTGVDATVGAGSLSTASFDANLAAVIGAGQLAANHAVLFTADAGDLAGQTFLVVDANGVAGYQAGSDYVIQLITPPASLVTGDFV